MNKTELKSFDNNLRALQARLLGDVSHLTNEALHGSVGNNGGSSGSSHSNGDLGSDNFEMEFTLSLVQNQEHVLEEISSALERIQQGTYGKCEECSKVIKKARLQALPYTRHCVECARKLQKST